ncbi:MAG TPA: branched-chain amino acid ABC transporter permease [Candidatus Dormibacteraeota bacterium]|nr:branched-chain amino acid ABC transporter permease [Candidatus Dormibacteraeota bacterium]
MATMVQRLRASVIRTPTASLVNLVGFAVVAVAAVATMQRVYQGGATYFFQTLGFGLAEGAIFALVALGYTMVYGIIELINFAHGDVFTLGAFISLGLMPVLGLTEGKISGAALILPLLGLFVITMLICALVNVGIERVAYRPLRHAPRLAPLITAIGMSALLEGVMNVWRGPYNLHYPDFLPEYQIPLFGGVTIAAKAVMVIVIAVILMVALTLFVNRSKLGKAMRATAQDKDAAQLMGIDINRTISATFFIGAALAGAGGIIYGLYYNSVQAFDGFQYGLYAFTAAVFGGIGNIPGAALGGMLIGIIFSISDGYFSVSWTQILIFGILIFVLVFRPTGLLGMRVPEK